MKALFVQLLLAAATVSAAGCGSNSGRRAPSVPSLSVIRAAGRDLPSVRFDGCLIPAGQPTWANILLTGAKGRFRGPYRAVWSIDRKVDSSDPQRTIAARGNGTRLELLVRLRDTGQTFHVEVFNTRGFVGGFSFLNTARYGARCNRDGLPHSSSPNTTR